MQLDYLTLCPSSLRMMCLLSEYKASIPEPEKVNNILLKNENKDVIFQVYTKHTAFFFQNISAFQIKNCDGKNLDRENLDRENCDGKNLDRENCDRFADVLSNVLSYCIHKIDCNLIYNIILPIRHERLFKPIILRQYPDMNIINTKRKELKEELKSLALYLDEYSWFSGECFSFADIIISTAISVLDYLGEISWDNPELIKLKDWYLNIKSRNSFKEILKEECQGIPAHANFRKLNF